MWQTEAEPLYQLIFAEKGDDVQKLSVVETLPQLLAEDAHSCITRVLPKIQQSLPTASAEFHMAASVIFKQVLEQRLVSHKTFTEVFLHSILNSLESREPAISHAWLETMIDVIELLPVDIIRREILPIAVNEGQISQTVNSRITCCQLMGKIATRFDSASIQKEILPTVQSLCHDVNNDVRASASLQLHYIAQNMGSDTMKLIPLVVELTSDEESNVRQATVQTISNLLAQLKPDTIKDIMIPLIKLTCENAIKEENDDIITIAQEFGKIVQSCETHLDLAEKTWFITFFIEIAQMGTSVTNMEESKHEFSFNMGNNIQINDKITECRRNCTFNIPAMFLFASTVPEGINRLIPVFRKLANDSNYMVRRTIACSLHEIIKVLGLKSGLIRIELMKLLKDNHEDVLQGLIPHISEILEHLLQNKLIGIDSAESSIIDLGQALIKCEAKTSSTYNWRLSVLMLNQFETLPKYFPSDFIYTYFVPIVIIRLLDSRPLPVRLAAGRVLLVFLRYNLDFQQRIELRNHFCTDIAHSSNSYKRMLFIRIMIEGFSIFSSVYFKEHFCSTLLSLMEDPIANVRLKIITLVPTIKSCLRLPADKKLLSTLETNIRNLMSNEKDRDVLATWTVVAGQMESIEVRIDSQPSPTKLSRYDSEDMKKYEEEKKLEGMLTNITDTNIAKKRPNIKPMDQRFSTTGTSSSVRSNSKANLQRSKEFPKSSVSPKPPLTRQNTFTTRQIPNQSKTSTSTDNLASNQSRFTSHIPLLIQTEERATSLCHNTNLTSTNPSYDYFNKYSSRNGRCSCYELAESIFQMQPFAAYADRRVGHYNLAECSIINDTNYLRKTNLSHSKHDYQFSNFTKPSLITNVRDDKHDIWQDLMLTRSSFVNKYTMPDFDRFQFHYNPYWTFSSVPKIPVTLVDDEFMVDAGIRIPSQLASSQRISNPNLQDIIHGNKKVSNTDRMRRFGSNFDKSVSMNFHLPRRLSVDQGKTLFFPLPSLPANFSSNGHEFHYNQSRIDDRSNHGDIALQNRTRFGFEFNERKLPNEQAKRSSTLADKNGEKPIQPRNVIDKNKRHSMSYSMKLPDTKESKPKFKRHSMEVSDYNPVDRSTAGRTLRRFSTLDVNHNQGLSKIPIRNTHASGSKTAPVTRTSSPIRIDSDLFEKAAYSNISNFSPNGHIRRFRSSGEEVEKLCQKI